MNQLLQRVRAGLPVEFAEVQAVIAAEYHYHPTAFHNGIGARQVVNAAGENEGSCRLLAFAKMQGLTQAQTLALFGHYYRDEVLGDPGGSSHANIRAFMADGWAGVVFEAPALTPR
ncbi:HopJ type III effector protein [Motiliproteus sediminis]|uniref:HopJ type III effector protein n=1 Tax=Motiliproteus sediminis TaxID=1468178 RepID=UPI001AF027C1|nr:HopJ type III effector protein [Motiliproteus sediminis]